MVIYAVKLTSSVGAQGPAIMLGYLLVSGMFLTLLRKPIAHMTVVEQQNEGEFRYINSRLIANAEEIAFYQGHKREELNVMNSFERLTNHYRNFITFRFAMGFIDNIIAKCALQLVSSPFVKVLITKFDGVWLTVWLLIADFATFIGYNAVSVPFFDATNVLNEATHNQRLEEYYRSGRMFVKMAEALGRIALAGRELTRLAGYTERVDQLLVVLDDLGKGVYKRTMVRQSNNEQQPRANVDNVNGNRPATGGKIVYKDNIIKWISKSNQMFLCVFKMLMFFKLF